MPTVCRAIFKDSGDASKGEKDQTQYPIEVLEPKEEFVVDAGHTLTVRVSPPSPVPLCLLIAMFGDLFDNEGLAASASTSLSLVAPKDPGTYTLRVWGFDATRRFFSADRTIHVKLPAGVESIEVQLSDSLAITLGSVEDYRFELGRPLLPVVLPRLLPHIRLLEVQDWPHPVQDKYYESRRFRVPFVWRGDEYLFRNFNNITVRARLAKVDPQSFYLVSKLTRSEMAKRDESGKLMDPGRTFHTLVYVTTGSNVKVGTILESVEGNSYNGMPLMFDIQSYGQKVLLVYASQSGIFQSLGEVTEDQINFGRGKLIHKLAGEVQDLQLSTSARKAHLLWSETGKRGGESKLYYMNAENPEQRWSAPRVISETANYGTGNMVIGNRQIYLAWSDHRYQKYKWGGPINAHKLFMMKSEDEGNSFSSPKLIGSRRDEKDKVFTVYLTLSGNNPVVLWLDDWGYRAKQVWRHGVLSGDIRSFQRLDDVPLERLEAAYANRLRQIYGAK